MPVTKTLPGDIHGDANACFLQAPTKVGGEDERRPVCIQLCYKGVARAASEGGLEGIRQWEVCGFRSPGQISIAGSVNGNAITSVIACTAEIRGITQHGINDEWFGWIVPGDSKGDLALAL